MPGQRRAIRDQVSQHWTRAARGSIVLATVVGLAVLAAAVTAVAVLLTGSGPPRYHHALSTTLASQQLAGLTAPGPGDGTTQRLLAPSGAGLSFLAGGGGGSVLSSQQWQANEMSDGSYVLVYVPEGNCLNAAVGKPGGAGARAAAQVTLKPCDLRLSQRWTHPYLGKDPTGRDYWQLRSEAAGQCLTASGTGWRDGTRAGLQPCGRVFGWQQLIEFWSAY